MTGETRVLVRGGPFGIWESAYPTPYCKFGDMKPVVATYTTCTKEKTGIAEREGRKKDRNYRCISCDFSPDTYQEGQLGFQISLIGDFSDSVNSVGFTYYPAIHIHNIHPRYGPKDGGTPVQVWGSNFRNFNDTALCGFGTRTVPASIKNDTYLECYSPQSDVVQKAIPFAISQNYQQFSFDTKYYWYYNWPSVKVLDPPRGPESGGTLIELKGRNFYPFSEILSEVDNAIDVFCGFIELKVRVPATVYNSTKATCIAPPSYYFKQSQVELTLNGVDYTEDENIFSYYKPPNIYDVDPREGPVRGGTNVTVSGTQFEDTGDQIKCDFGGKVVTGKYINSQQILCVAPNGGRPGYQPLRLAIQPDLWSNPVKYLYYETPTVQSFQPICGPDTGFTQIEVTGENFLDLGANKAMCVFNKTIFTNATIFSENTLYCDSPPFLNAQGYSLHGSNGLAGDFYEVELTMDGGVELEATNQKFSYYKQPQVLGVYPFGGPLKGQNPVTVNVTGLTQSSICELKIRLSTQEIDPTVLNSDQMQIYAPSVTYPGTVVVGVSFNGQQYTDERIVHLKDPLASYEYYSDPIVTFHTPHQGPSTGGTPIKIFGQGFKTFKPQKDADPKGPVQAPNKLWVRFTDIKSGKIIYQEELKDFRNDEASFVTPPQPPNTQALIEISRNGEDWTPVKDPNPSVTYSFTYYTAPHITKLVPSFGPVKPDGNGDITIQGSDFVCPAGNCKNVKVRFQDHEGNQIFAIYEVVNSNTITAKIPKYTKPDVLEVEISMNGLDFTNDNKTYGYYDPYVIDAQPRLISVKGTTIVTVSGVGFVDSGEVKTKFSDKLNEIVCDGKACTQNAQFLDANHIKTTTLPQSALVYKNSSTPVMWDPFQISVSVYSDQFTDNDIKLHYYHDPKFTMLGGAETPCNIQAELLVGVNIDPSDLDNLRQFGKPKCRFTGAGHVLYTEGIFVHSSKGPGGSTTNDPNSIRCVTPIWQWDAQPIKLDLTLNGHDYSGDIDFRFGEDLILHRVVPMAGPLSISTHDTRLLGQGFKPTDPNLEYESKWGVLSTQTMKKSFVKDYKYHLVDFLAIDNDNEELKCYLYEASSFKRQDSQIDDGRTLTMYGQPSPILGNQTSQEGGPFYVEVGRNIEIDNYNMASKQGRRLEVVSTKNQTSNLTTNMTVATPSYIFYEYQPSSVEFYHYKQCSMLSIHPTHGLTRGGTPVQVLGFDFRYWPEWGVVPHCKFGDQIVRGYFDSTVRIVCDSPSNDEAAENLSFEVSLNGHDWTQTGITYSYYREPVMTSYAPDSGQSQGGTSIYISGKNFPRMANPKEFNAKFTPQSAKESSKIMPVEWLNDTMLKVTTPGGWSQGDKMDFQITFNGQDYDQNHFTFTFYNIAQVKPRSGPSDGLGGDIIISGQGFRSNTQPLCRLNQTVSQPTSFTWTEIRCPMVAAEQGPDYFGNVDFAISVNNGADWHTFSGGFQYYEQPKVDDIHPKSGPAHGVGVINFYGSGFRSDYALVDLECKIGNNIGVAVFISKNQIRCVVEDMDQVSEGQRLPAQVALNGYSWTATNDHPDDTGSTFFIPYSVNAIFPNSGRVTGDSEVLIIGSGFIEDELFQPRCRFGTPNNYAITQAQIVSFNKLVCLSPPMPSIKHPEVLPMEMPFSLAFTQDNFDPWTATHHRFRYYKSPVINEIFPTEVEVGLITEILVTIDPSLDPQNVFFEPFPAEASNYGFSQTGNENSEASEVAAALLMGNHIKCKFGRFGETLAVYVNETSIKCVTPSVLDEPEDIYREKVMFSIAMNGYDYDFDANSFDFTFVGTGSQFGLGPAILTILLVGVLLVAFIIFIQNYYFSLSMNGSVQNAVPYVVNNGDAVEHPGLRQGPSGNLRSQSNYSNSAQQL